MTIAASGTSARVVGTILGVAIASYLLAMFFSSRLFDVATRRSAEKYVRHNGRDSLMGYLTTLRWISLIGGVLLIGISGVSLAQLLRTP